MAKEDEDEKTKEEVEAATEEAPTEEAPTEEAPTEEAPAEEGMDEPNEEESETALANREAFRSALKDELEAATEDILRRTGGAGTDGLSDASGVQKLINQLAGQIQQERAGAVELAKQKPGAPDLADLVVALLPAAIGAAVGDSRTALAGAVGGMTGLSERRAKEREAISEEIKAREKYAQTLEGRLTDLQGRVAVALENRLGGLPHQVLQQMADYTVSAVQVQQTLDWVNKFFPNDESITDYAARLKDQYLSTGLTNAQILSQLKASLRLALQSAIKGIPSNADQKIIDEIISGGDITIKGVQQFKQALRNSVAQITLQANMLGAGYKRFQRGEPMTTEYIEEMASRVPIAGIETPEDEEKQKKESAKEVQQREVGTVSRDGIILFKRPNGVMSEASIDAPWLSEFLNLPENVDAMRDMQSGRISSRNKLAFQQRLNEHVAKTLAAMQTQQSTNTQ